MKTAILTDFINYDEAYSLCQVVKNQVKALDNPVLCVRQGFHDDNSYPGAIIKVFDHGETGSNTVILNKDSDGEIKELVRQFEYELKDIDVILTHDLIYQPNMWKAHVAARRFAKNNPQIKWLHWVHSATNMNVIKKTGQFRKELQGKFPNSRLVAMHPEEVSRKGSLYGYEQDEIVVIPNPVDITEYYHPITRQLWEELNLCQQDIIALYPCRLDRGKQPHIILEIFEELELMDYRVKVIIADFHSISGDKDTYRQEMKDRYGTLVKFTSDIGGYMIPHRAIMDLFEIADVLIHPSMSESDPLILPEAMWKRCGLVLNFDNPVFRQYDRRALFGKFSSSIDINTGMPGSTITEYGDRQAYMKDIAKAIVYQCNNNPVLSNHIQVRQTRSIEVIKQKLEETLVGN